MHFWTQQKHNISLLRGYLNFNKLCTFIPFSSGLDRISRSQLRWKDETQSDVFVISLYSIQFKLCHLFHITSDIGQDHEHGALCK